MVMSPRDWDKEMAKIDKQLESVSDKALTGKADAGGTRAQVPAGAASREPKTTSTLGVFTRLVLAVALGIAMIFWPYSTRCGVGLFSYLFASAVVVVAGVWTSVWTWRHRAAQGHILSLLLVAWGLILAAQAILPRTGYARSDAAHPAIWMCQ